MTDLDPQLVDLGIRLSEAAARNTASTIATRIGATRTAKKDRETIVELEEIIQELSEDRNELLQIAQAYREEVAGQKLADADVEYITSQLVPKLKEFVASDAFGVADAESVESLIDALAPLLSMEALTILQLLGLNFREAIGRPLTNLIAALIAAKMPTISSSEIQKLSVEREVAYLALAQDEAAFGRFSALSSGLQ